MKKLSDSILFLSNKRARKIKKRRDRYQKKYKRFINHQKSKNPNLTLNIYRSEIIDLLAEQRCGGRLSNQKGKKDFILKRPINYAFSTDPRDALCPIFDLAWHIRNYECKSLFHDHSEVKEIDLSSEVVMRYILSEIDNEYASQGKQIHHHGRVSNRKDKKTIRINKLIRGVGTIRQLASSSAQLSSSEQAALEVFYKTNYPETEIATSGATTHKERSAVQFTDHINKCLNRVGWRLNRLARKRLSDYTAEITDNIWEHSGQNNWFIAGYLDTDYEPKRCEITICNFGLSMAETFLKLPPNHYSWNKVSRYIEMHKHRSLFCSDWRQEDLLTLLALQGSISSKNIDELDSRGNGTLDLLGFFQKMSDECSEYCQDGNGNRPKMFVLSGSTHILIDGRYTLNFLSPKSVNAFNKDNDLLKRPDYDLVTPLHKFHFPGTIVGIEFPLVDASLESSG